MTYACLACRSTAGTPADDDHNEEWYWKPLGRRHAGPFCSLECADAWLLLPLDDQLESIFGQADRARVSLARVADGRFIEDVPAVGSVLYLLGFDATIHVDLVPDNAALKQTKCPHPTQKSRPHLINPDCCPDCMFKQPMDWREVVTR